jgi:hypothetical protein
MKSQRVFNGVSECIARSLSMWDNVESCTEMKKLPMHKTKVIVKVVLSKKDGKLLPTFKPSHCSWWRTKSFNVKNCVII